VVVGSKRERGREEEGSARPTCSRQHVVWQASRYVHLSRQLRANSRRITATSDIQQQYHLRQVSSTSAFRQQVRKKRNEFS
jgi:hypothetical protein